MSILLSAAIACSGKHAPVVAQAHQDQTVQVLERYVAYRLEPARLPPPSLSSRSQEIQIGELTARAELVLAEEAEWNAWPDGTSRLFNNTAAHLFDVSVEGGGHLLRWLPDTTRLELNVVGNAFPVAPTQETLLEELVFWGFQQERAVLEGDLASRARAAAGLRKAYLEPVYSDRIDGLIAFPLVATDTNRPHLDGQEPEQLHVVSMRLTLGVEIDGELDQLVWTFD